MQPAGNLCDPLATYVMGEEVDHMTTNIDALDLLPSRQREMNLNSPGDAPSAKCNTLLTCMVNGSCLITRTY